MSKIILLGAAGMIGSRILKEAVNRGHTVTAISRHIDNLHEEERVKIIQADANDIPDLIALSSGQDAMISSLSPRGENGREQYLSAIRSVITAAKTNHTPFVLFVGGMSNLFTSNGRRILDQILERVAAENLVEPITVAEARAIVEKSDINWTFFCPGGSIEPGERTGKFRLGGTQALADLGTPLRISAEDYAVAAIDELEHPEHLRQIFNICY